MADRIFPSPEDLRAALSYDAKSGLMTWLCRDGDAMFNARFAGKPALNAAHKSGYKCGKFSGRSLLAHRAAWALHYGNWPEGEIDHINGNKSDNRICNLRLVDREGNCKNKRLRKDNASGVAGVCFDAAKGKWVAYVSSGGKWVYLGAYGSKHEAVSVRQEAEHQNGYHPNNGRVAALP